MEGIEIHHGSNESLNRRVAVSVALLAALMGVCKIKDDNICRTMLQIKSDSVDTWSEYQSKSLKLHLQEISALTLHTAELSNPGIHDELAADLGKVQSDTARYEKEKSDLKTKAQGFEHQYDALNFRHDQFDLCDAALSIALALFAVTALVDSAGLFYLSWIFGAFGALMGIAGLSGWALHPDWLVKLLS